MEYEDVCRTDAQGNCELDTNNAPIIIRQKYDGVDVSPDGYLANREVNDPRGIWSDGETFWVVGKDNDDNAKVFAFALPKDCSRGDNYCRRPTKDFDLAAENDNPWGITAGWSGVGPDRVVDTWWVTNPTEDEDRDNRLDKKLYAYNRSDGSRNSALDFDLSQLDISNLQQYFYGLAATETIMYVAEYITGRVYSFSMPGVSGPIGPALVSSDKTLKSLSLSNATLSPSSPDPAVSIYTAMVENDVTSTTITAVPNHPSATAQVLDGGVIASGGVVQLDLIGSSPVNTFTVRVTAQDGSTKDYTVAVERRALSTDATLDSLTLSGAPAVDLVAAATSTGDSVTVDSSLDETTVLAVPNDSRVKSVVYKLDGNAVTANSDPNDAIPDGDHVMELAVGLNEITVEVTAEDDSVETYTVTVTRERALSDNAMLNALVLMYGDQEVLLMPTFDAAENSYEAEVAYGVTSLVVKYELRDTNAKNVTVRFGGAKDANDVVEDEEVKSNIDDPGMAEDTSTSVGLSEGENTLTVEVTAENGIAKQAYEVSIERADASNDATLARLSLDPGALDQSFFPRLLSVGASVGHDDATTKLSIVPGDGDTATVVVKYGGTVVRDVLQGDSVTGGTDVDRACRRPP